MADRIEGIVERAVDMAAENSHEYVTLEHLLYCLLQEDEVADVINKCNAEVPVLKEKVGLHITQDKKDIVLDDPMIKPQKTQSLERVFHRAFTQVIFSGRKALEPKDLLVSIMSETESYAHYFLLSNGVDKDKLIQVLTKDHAEGEAGSLEQWCINLNEEAKENKIDPLIGREEEVLALLETLARRRKNNVIIVKGNNWHNGVLVIVASKIVEKFNNSIDPETSVELLRGFDRELKARNYNPGTSADLTAASLLVYNLIN